MLSIYRIKGSGRDGTVNVVAHTMAQALACWREKVVLPARCQNRYGCEPEDLDDPIEQDILDSVAIAEPSSIECADRGAVFVAPKGGA